MKRGIIKLLKWSGESTSHTRNIQMKESRRGSLLVAILFSELPLPLEDMNKLIILCYESRSRTLRPSYILFKCKRHLLVGTRNDSFVYYFFIISPWNRSDLEELLLPLPKFEKIVCLYVQFCRRHFSTWISTKDGRPDLGNSSTRYNGFPAHH